MAELTDKQRRVVEALRGRLKDIHLDVKHLGPTQGNRVWISARSPGRYGEHLYGAVGTQGGIDISHDYGLGGKVVTIRRQWELLSVASRWASNR